MVIYGSCYGNDHQNFPEIFCYGVNRYHYNKYIGIIEISEKLALDLFNNIFTTDTGNM